MPDSVLSLRNVALSLTANAGKVDIPHDNRSTCNGETMGWSPKKKKGAGPGGGQKTKKNSGGSLLMLMGGLRTGQRGTIHRQGRKDLTAMTKTSGPLSPLHMGVCSNSFHLIRQDRTGKCPDPLENCRRARLRLNRPTRN